VGEREVRVDAQAGLVAGAGDRAHNATASKFRADRLNFQKGSAGVFVLEPVGVVRRILTALCIR
jgi:hypothetical protein